MACTVMLTPDWVDRLSGETVEEFSAGRDTRTNLLLFTPEALRESPWIGHGPGNYPATTYRLVVYKTNPSLGTLEKGGLEPHNSWSGTAVEAGIFALLGLCLWLYGIGRPLWQAHRTADGRLNNLWAFAPLIFVQLLTFMFFGDGLVLPQVWFWFGMLLALTRVMRQHALLSFTPDTPSAISSGIRSFP